MHNRRFLWILTLAFSLGQSQPALADHAFDVAPVQQPNSPLEILSCDAKTTDTLGGAPDRFFYAGCHVINHGDRVITAFQLVFVAGDSFGTILGDYDFTVEGNYAHDVFIDLHNHAGGAYFETVNPYAGVRAVRVLVWKVRYADGTSETIYHKSAPNELNSPAPLQ